MSNEGNWELGINYFFYPVPSPQYLLTLTINFTEPTGSFFQVEFCVNIAIFTDDFLI